MKNASAAGRSRSRPAVGGWRPLSALLIATLVIAALAGCQLVEHQPAVQAGAPRFSPGGPEAEAYGRLEGYPVRAVERQKFRVGIYSHQDQLLEGRTVRRSATPSPLARAAAEPAIRYRFAGRTLTLDDYLARNPATGLLIARRDAAGGHTILAERYQYARHDRHRFTSASMAKTVTAMLFGIALAEGRIRSLDDTAASYVAALAGTEYGRTPLRELLRMSSGVAFEEVYPDGADVRRLWLETGAQQGPGGAAAVLPFNRRQRWPGAVFAYSSAETQVLGLVLTAATGRTLADYLHEKIWEPLGAEADANWIVDAAGQEAAYCCLNAVLRDWGRLALMLAGDGRFGQRQVVPREWLIEATSVPPDRPDLAVVWPEPRLGYGYQTWIIGAGGARRMFALLGVSGQAIYVDPASGLVLVHTAVRTRLDDPNLEALALWRGILESIADRPARRN